ncbi:3-oxoacid CoA-transferase subunit B [Lysinibacillus sp. Bpr_S20]|uniref:3-oxoacid CoA-transferase subunit B n=1 Tax=Lysinibacillus sp. Bpr_S20 TaxID=2933964 RepID=UPI0020114EB9|nr:3-oxoacid CoA-transferase subunit B [Lysinibacillus sp. Bpr_S20]
MNEQQLIASRVAQEIVGPAIVNLGIGIPTLVSEYVKDDTIIFHTENGLLGVTDIDPDNIDPNLVNAGKLPIGEKKGSSFFNSADSFAMIRGGHIDVAILGALQVDQTGLIANWAVPGKTILGVGGAMDLLSGAKQIIVAMTHCSKEGKSKLVKECSYPITSTRSVDIIVTNLAVFHVKDHELFLVDLMPGVTLEIVQQHTEAMYKVALSQNQV